MRPETGVQRFVRGLLAGATANRHGDAFVLPDGRRAAAGPVLKLIGSGALGGGNDHCVANAETRSWLKRAQLDADAFAAQHRVTEPCAGGPEINLAESPLVRLASRSGTDAAFLERHHLEAGERVRKLVERAQLQPRLTMAYSASRTAGNRQQAASDISDLAADARRAVAEIHRLLPRDCAGVVMDVCGLLKGLQTVERERGWPRRSAKLVLRIGLEQLAQHYGLGQFAVGRDLGRQVSWREEGARPERFE
jgi:hypothetical protein